jgi:fido (protein-threonine AMPylation protein)
MGPLNKKQQQILEILISGKHLSSSLIHKELSEAGEKNSLITVKRTLAEMSASKLLTIVGSGPGTTYKIGTLGRLYFSIDAHQYCAIEPDKRVGMSQFNFALLEEIPSKLFSNDEQKILEAATEEYRRRTVDTSPTLQKKELERLVIELSWKSSRIEGNTYTLLDTEKLIIEHQEALGHSKSEAHMILNHKDAFLFVHENVKRFNILSRSNLEEIHTLLVKNLDVGLGLRRSPVGVLGSKYRPLDNVHQITDALLCLFRAIEIAETPYDKALIALLGISYIQPFEDGNKRTSRLATNALLLAHGTAPLSYRSVDENEYREAMLSFYELNSIVPLKKIFITQYDFAARNYAVK